MLFSLIHPGTGSSSQSKLDTFELVRLIQSLFGLPSSYSSLMEPRCTFGAWQSQRALPKPTLLLTDLEIATLRPPTKTRAGPNKLGQRAMKNRSSFRGALPPAKRGLRAWQSQRGNNHSLFHNLVRKLQHCSPPKHLPLRQCTGGNNFYPQGFLKVPENVIAGEASGPCSFQRDSAYKLYCMGPSKYKDPSEPGQFPGVAEKIRGHNNPARYCSRGGAPAIHPLNTIVNRYQLTVTHRAR